MSLRKRSYLGEFKLPPPRDPNPNAGKKPKGEIKSVSKIDKDARYTVWEKTPSGVWVVDRSYLGIYFRGEGKFFITSKKHAVVPVK